MILGVLLNLDWFTLLKGSWAAAIAQLLEDPAKRAEYGVLARKRILEKFNWQGAAKRTADVYIEAIAQKRT